MRNIKKISIGLCVGIFLLLGNYAKAIVTVYDYWNGGNIGVQEYDRFGLRYDSDSEVIVNRADFCLLRNTYEFAEPAGGQLKMEVFQNGDFVATSTTVWDINDLNLSTSSPEDSTIYSVNNCSLRYFNFPAILMHDGDQIDFIINVINNGVNKIYLVQNTTTEAKNTTIGSCTTGNNCSERGRSVKTTLYNDNGSLIEFNYPKQSDIVKDFNSWKVYYNGGTDELTNPYVFIYYGTTTEMYKVDYEKVSESTSTVLWSLAKRTNLTDGTWYAQAILYNLENCSGGLCDYVKQDETVQISFEISSSTGSGEFDLTTDQEPTEMSAESVCSKYSENFIVEGLCKILVTMFQPSSASLKQFGNLKSEVANKPPFGYALLIQEKFNTMSTSSIVYADVSWLDYFGLKGISTGVFGLMFVFYVLKRLEYLNV